MTRDSYTACKQIFKCTKYNYLYTSVNTSGSHSTPQGVDGQLNQIECQSLTRRVLYHQQNWGVLTQDNWVLQTVQGYLIDLTHTPHQSHIPPPIDLSQEKHALVTQEVQELLSKGAIVESIPSPMSFISQIFLVEKRGGGNDQ